MAMCFLLSCESEDAEQDPKLQWEQLKADISPQMAEDFANSYELPFRQPLSAFGWEDGLHVSSDGLHLYALYYPGDLLAWTQFFMANIDELELCELLGNTDYIRPYAETFEIDMNTNSLGCEDFINVDILYSNRISENSSFTEWQLSNIARPATVEGSPFPLFEEEDASKANIFLFTRESGIWMIRNTTANPSGIEGAIRLPAPINPETNEFNPDNPHLERLEDDRLLLVFEKYINSDIREFYYSHSQDNGENWDEPIKMNTISSELGKIEHPHLYKDQEGQWWMYFSLNCDIYRAKQMEPNDWDAWVEAEKVIDKGNSNCVGEPTLTDDGDISFVVVYENKANGNNKDTHDIDPWYVHKIER